MLHYHYFHRACSHHQTPSVLMTSPIFGRVSYLASHPGHHYQSLGLKRRRGCAVTPKTNTWRIGEKIGLRFLWTDCWSVLCASRHRFLNAIWDSLWLLVSPLGMPRFLSWFRVVRRAHASPKGIHQFVRRYSGNLFFSARGDFNYEFEA